ARPPSRPGWVPSPASGSRAASGTTGQRCRSNRCRSRLTPPRPPSTRGTSISSVAARRDFTSESLAAGVRAGDRRALARAITLVENSEPLAYELVRELYPETGRAYAVGITGPPGVGKSTLIGALVRHVRAQERSVGARDTESAWKPPIVLTEASRGENVPELWEEVEEHRAFLESEGRLEEQRRRNLAGEVFAVASARAKAHLERAVADDPEL